MKQILKQVPQLPLSPQEPLRRPSMCRAMKHTWSKILLNLVVLESLLFPFTVRYSLRFLIIISEVNFEILLFYYSTRFLFHVPLTVGHQKSFQGIFLSQTTQFQDLNTVPSLLEVDRYLIWSLIHLRICLSVIWSTLLNIVEAP